MKSYIEGLKVCADELLAQEKVINEITCILKYAYDRGDRVFIMGNGGSATTASHFARDLKIGAKGRLKLLTECLNDSMAVITSLANDMDYSEVFAEQLDGQMNDGDVLIAFSCSGNSQNILQALIRAHRSGFMTVGIAGCDGGLMRKYCRKLIPFKSKDFGQLEDIHLSVCHILTNKLREKIQNES
jgi:D-sedoheptulose 7-phosphate isomerase